MNIPPHKRNQKVERKALKSKPPFRSQPKILDGSKFVLTCHHCGVIGHIRPQCPNPFPKLDLRENGKLLKKFFDVLTSLSMCIFGSHSYSFRLTSHKTLIPKNHFV